jgi:hypothetical protein
MHVSIFSSRRIMAKGIEVIEFPLFSKLPFLSVFVTTCIFHSMFARPYILIGI